MTAWQLVWRHGIAPQLTTTGLLALRQALESDDGRLIQGATTEPPPLQVVLDWPVLKACAVCFALWQGGGDFHSVGQVEAAFARACHAADQAFGEPAACRYFLNWFDQTPREPMRQELLAEVNQALVSRPDARGLTAA
jgi:hypothetical protein